MVSPPLTILQPRWLVNLFIVIIRLYQRFLSPLLGPRCRFSPSCSTYAIEALACHGLGRGVGLTVWRLLRCHPFSAGGYDPVPEREQ